jgi:hypothetical protein
MTRGCRSQRSCATFVIIAQEPHKIDSGDMPLGTRVAFKPLKAATVHPVQRVDSGELLRRDAAEPVSR